MEKYCKFAADGHQGHVVVAGICSNQGPKPIEELNEEGIVDWHPSY